MIWYSANHPLQTQIPGASHAQQADDAAIMMSTSLNYHPPHAVTLSFGNRLLKLQTPSI